MYTAGQISQTAAKNQEWKRQTQIRIKESAERRKGGRTMSMFPDCRTDDIYSEDFLNDEDKAFIYGADRMF